MKTSIIIPARYQSTRFPGKPLIKLHDTECIRHTYQAAKRVKGVDAVYVATDDSRIEAVCQQHQIPVIMTSDRCLNGSERVAEAMDAVCCDEDDIIINLQGDAPLTPPWFIEAMIEAMINHPEFKVVTPVIRCDLPGYQRLKNDRMQGRVGATTVVFDKRHQALYFSKELVPYLPVVTTESVRAVCHHAGVYGYRAQTLSRYIGWGTGPLESVEQLEQLRFIENGIALRVVEVEDRGHQFWELNNPEDVKIIEEMILHNCR